MRGLWVNLGRWVVVISMTAALGGHWLALQTVAWTGMLISNSRHAGLTQAMHETFDGDHPCPLCQSIQKGRQSEKQQDDHIVTGKLDLFIETGTLVLIHPGQSWRQGSANLFAQAVTQTPLLPPPRVSRVS